MLVSNSDVCSVSSKEIAETSSPNRVSYNLGSSKPQISFSPLDSGSLTDTFRDQLQHKGKSSQNSSPNQSIFDGFSTSTDHKSLYESPKSLPPATSGPWSQSLSLTSTPTFHQDWSSRLFDTDPVLNGYELANYLDHRSVGMSSIESGANCPPNRKPNNMIWNESVPNSVISRGPPPSNTVRFSHGFESDIYASTFRLLNEESSRNTGHFPHLSHYSPFGYSASRTQSPSDKHMPSNWNWSTPLSKPQKQPSTTTMSPNRQANIGYGNVEPNEKMVPSRNQIDVWKIAHGYDNRTTFMIRNIPNRYTQKMLLECLDETHKGEYDFVYLRMDFKNHCNVGYAFINFIDVSAVLSFIEKRVGRKWSKFNSDKICHLSYANIQGKTALIEKFRNSSVMEKDPSYRPKIFYSSGILKGMEEPFPLPGKVMSTQTEKNFEDTYQLPTRIFPSQVDFNVLNPTMVLQHQQLSCVKTPNKVDWKVDWQEFDSDTDSGISNSLEDSLDTSFGSLTISGPTGTNAAGHFACKN